MSLRKSALRALMIAGCLAGRAGAYGAWGVGPLGGINLANADVGGQESRGVTGWAVGARLEMGMNPLMALAVDPMLVSHEAEFDPPSGDFAGRAQFSFLEIPLFLKLRLGLANIGVNAFAGPNLTLLWDVNGRFGSAREITTDDFQTASLAADVGLGFAFGVAPFVDITADARYSHGLSDLLGDGGVGEVDHWLTRDVRLVLGVLLNTGP